jgi:hypothetical protein
MGALLAVAGKSTAPTQQQTQSGGSCYATRDCMLCHMVELVSMLTMFYDGAVGS